MLCSLCAVSRSVTVGLGCAYTDQLTHRDYIDASFLPKEEGIYDYISVDGRVCCCTSLSGPLAMHR